MTPPLFLVPDLGVGPQIELTGPEAHHAAVVRRLVVGEVVLLADGRGGVARTEVLSAARERVTFTVLERLQLQQPRPLLVVAQALPKGDRAELAVELLTELGVDEIVPWAASRSVSIWRDDKIDKGLAKWRRTALEASKQSRRARIPVIGELRSTSQLAERLRLSAPSIVLHEDATAPLASFDVASGSGELVLVVGPEGGITDDELAILVDAGAQPCKLGPEVMRTSTAGGAALAVLSAALGRWR